MPPPSASQPVSEMNRAWDKGSKTQRMAILTDFLKRHRSSTAAEIERDLGHGSLLFFTRLTAWLRLTYRLGTAVSLQLSALSVFLQGQRYLTQFMEVGGIQALTDLVSICKATRQEDKNNALLLLLHIANSGRVYREMVCDGEGIEMLVKAAVDESQEKTLELMGALFLALGQGNPRKASAVHSGLLYIMLHGRDDGALCAATTLRSLQLAKQTYVGEQGTAGMVGVETGSERGQGHVLEAFFHLLSSANVKLRFEGMELLGIAAQNPLLLAAVLRRCLETLEASELSFDAEPTALQPVRRLKASCGRILSRTLHAPLPLEQAEQVLVLCDRFSAHITLGKHIRSCDGRDAPGAVDACRALRALAVGPYRASLGTNANAHVSATVTAWMKRKLGPELLDELLSADSTVTDELGLRVAAHLVAAEASPDEGVQGSDGALPPHAGRSVPDP